MNKLPIALIYSRLVIGILILILSIAGIENFRIIAIVLISIGLLTDIFDGIIARQLNISTPKFRRLDSAIDQVFFISFAFAAYLQCPDFFRANSVKLIFLFGSEGLAYLICFLKFKKEIATHSIGSKIWALLLFATLVEILWRCQSDTLFNICFWVGIVTRFEIVAIILTLKQWTSDVPSVYHSWQLRQGKEIRRHKMFNG
ncbi:MAG: CDP-alcohol phosphatidyltransferase family protein [Bacteroidetes bacterium]|nr:CDP-alcohol phosphatidyltransferase family protein [Bacteroidota bacterium]